MSDFKAKMHQIRFPLGLCPRPRWGSLQHSPRPPDVFNGPTAKRGGEREGREGEGRVPQLGSLDPAAEEGREGEKSKEGSLGWGVQALLFSTLSTAKKLSQNCQLPVPTV